MGWDGMETGSREAHPGMMAALGKAVAVGGHGDNVPRVSLPAAGGTPGPTVPVALGGGGGGTALLERGKDGSVMD